jgi:exodeoxyribonuclease-5
MVCKNNYFWTEKYDDLPFLANGDLLEVVRLRNEREMYGYHFVDAQLRSLDYDWEIDTVIWLDTMHSDTPEANQKMQKDLFNKIAEDYPELQNNRKKLTEAIYQSSYYNALQIRMAYAITGHKSQGGQWARVFIDPYKGGEQNMTPSADEQKEFFRWLYTAVTRATEKVYFIKNN